MECKMEDSNEGSLTVVVCGSDDYADAYSTSGDKQLRKWVTSLEKALEEVKDYEKQTQAKFIMQRRRSYDIDKARIRWDCTDNFPYKIVRVHKMECEHAKDRNKQYNDKRRDKLAMQSEVQPRVSKRKKYKRYISAHVSKKTDCPAFIEILEAEIYPQYQLSTNATVRQRKTSSQVLRYDLATRHEDVYKELFCRITFPANGSHVGHAFGEDTSSRHQLDSRLVEKIDEMVAAGISSMRDIKQTLTLHVGEMFKDQELPCKSHRRFWPTRKVICQHYVDSCIQQNKVRMDGDNITLAPGKWDKPATKDSVFYYYFATAAEKPATSPLKDPPAEIIEEVVANSTLEEVNEVYEEEAFGNDSELMQAYTNFYPDQAQPSSHEDLNRKVASSISNSLEQIYKAQVPSGIVEVKQHLEYALQKLKETDMSVDSAEDKDAESSDIKRPRLSIILCHDEDDDESTGIEETNL